MCIPRVIGWRANLLLTPARLSRCGPHIGTGWKRASRRGTWRGGTGRCPFWLPWILLARKLTLSTAARPGIKQIPGKTGEQRWGGGERTMEAGEDGWGWGEARVSRAARGHVRPGLASTQREVRIGAKQQQLLPSRWTPQMLCQRELFYRGSSFEGIDGFYSGQNIM
jgi:hypothetical protein